MIALGLVMIVLAPATSVAGRMWVNPPCLDWAMLLVMAAGSILDQRIRPDDR